MSTNEHILARLKELKSAVSERVVAASARERSWRVSVLQSLLDGQLAGCRAAPTAKAAEGVPPLPPPADWKDAPLPKG